MPEKNTMLWKKAFVLLLLLAVVMPVFAAGNGTTGTEDNVTMLDDMGEKILKLLSGTWVKALCMVALVIEAIGVVMAGQQGGGSQIIKRFGPWIVGTVILLSASSITSYFLKDLDLTL